MFKILDCTLRDGGYYTNWDFSPEVIDAYIQAMNQLPLIIWKLAIVISLLRYILENWAIHPFQF